MSVSCKKRWEIVRQLENMINCDVCIYSFWEWILIIVMHVCDAHPIWSIYYRLYTNIIQVWAVPIYRLRFSFLRTIPVPNQENDICYPFLQLVDKVSCMILPLFVDLPLYGFPLEFCFCITVFLNSDPTWQNVNQFKREKERSDLLKE